MYFLLLSSLEFRSLSLFQQIITFIENSLFQLVLQYLSFSTMILEIAITLFILLVLYIIQTCVIYPKKLMKGYADNFKAKGYRVCHFSFSFLYNHYLYTLNLMGKSGQDKDPYKMLREDYPKYDVYVANLLNKPLLQLCGPELIKHYHAVDKHYSYPKFKIGIDTFSRVIGFGLPFSEGKQWKKKRAVLNKVFNFDFLKSQTANIAAISDRCIKETEDACKYVIDQKSGQKSVEIDVLDLLMKIFSQVMLSSFLGMKTDEKIEGLPVSIFLKVLMDDAIESGQQLVSLLFGQKFMKLGIRKMDRSISRRTELYKEWGLPFIKKRIQQIEQNIKNNPTKTESLDIIEALIAERNKQNENSSQSNFTQQDIFNEFTSFFFAGTETTSNYLQMIIYYIAKDPEIERKVREQISKYMSTDDYSFENLKNLKYIDNIQKETTRLYGPSILLFYRIAEQDNYLNDIPIKKGTIISITNHGNHLSQKYFKNPEEFRPQRWDEKQCQELPSFVMGGFSFGARSCIGKHLAMIESKIALVKFMKRYKSIMLPNKNFKMVAKFVIGPETFKTKLIINE